MTIGRSKMQTDLFRSVHQICDATVGERSVFRLLAEEGHRLFADEMFEDLYSRRGRRSIPPRVMATVMVLQRFEGLSDVDAVERLQFDLRYKWACGVAYDGAAFDPTLLVDMRARLRNSARPDRIFEAVLEVAKQAKIVGRKRIVDSTALYDAVATQDTVTLVRSAIVGVLRVAGDALAAELRAPLKRDDAYDKPGKPSCAWDDKHAREELIDALTRDALALLVALDDRELSAELASAMKLLATVVGQDIEQGEDGRYRIVRGVAKGRVISTVDPEARHGHKTESRSYDGYKGHIAIDADSEMITATTVTAANVSDAAAAEELLADVLEAPEKQGSEEKAEVFGDASYGAAELVEKLEGAGVEPNVKVQEPAAREGMYSQNDFAIDTHQKTACCPAGVRVALRVLKDGFVAEFGSNCTSCMLRNRCTNAKNGRTLKVHLKHDVLDRNRKRQRDEEWKKRYRKVRPRVERKIAHLMRHRHGGRRARVRGRERVQRDFAMLAASVNLARLAALGVRIVATLA
jgi:transposase